MIHLTANEARVLGVLVEKAQTTPQQYPMSLNGLVAGCNQKNNRDPVLDLNDESVQDALDGLREKNIVRQVELTGSRVPKFRHVARETLEVDTNQLVVLAELLLRGPQTVGELRGRASRMHQLESLDAVENVLKSLMERAEPLIERLAPLPGTRAERYQQLLSPELNAVHHIRGPSPQGPVAAPVVMTSSPDAEAALAISGRIELLERRLSDVEATLTRIEAVLHSAPAAT
jgi:uncharacterized protein YceH (UPF0502 family)